MRKTTSETPIDVEQNSTRAVQKGKETRSKKRNSTKLDPESVKGVVDGMQFHQNPYDAGQESIAKKTCKVKLKSLSVVERKRGEI